MTRTRSWTICRPRLCADATWRALAEAQAAGARGEVPIGAVVTASDGAISPPPATARASCPTRPRTPRCWRSAQPARSLGSERLVGCDLYVTLEPCPMCAAAISFARVRRLYYGAPDPKGGGVEHGARVFSQPTCHHAPEIYRGHREERAAALLQSVLPGETLGFAASAPEQATAVASSARARQAPWAPRAPRACGNVSASSTRASCAFNRSLAGCGGGEDLLELQEVEHLIAARPGVDVDVGLARAQLLLDDRALENESLRQTAPPTPWAARDLPRRIGAPLTSTATVRSASPHKRSKGSGLTRPPSISTRPSSVTGSKMTGSAMLAAIAWRSGPLSKRRPPPARRNPKRRSSAGLRGERNRARCAAAG